MPDRRPRHRRTSRVWILLIALLIPFVLAECGPGEKQVTIGLITKQEILAVAGGLADGTPVVFLISMAIVGNVSEFFDMFLIGFIVNILIKAPGWHLTGLHSGIILAGAGLGTVLGSITWGRLADRLGRKTAFIWCIVVLVAFTAASAFTPTNG